MASSFQPSVWGDFFINYSSPLLQKSEEWMKERANQLKDHVRGLFGLSNDVVETMHLVDALQRLGIDHHFEEQIVAMLRSIHGVQFNSCNLHDVALRFRLLRQHGFWVSLDEFNKFKGEDGTFVNNSEITNDPRGLLSLYNAAHLLTHGETVLEEAILFSRHHLKSMATKLKSPLAEQVCRALQIPLPRIMKRIETLKYISEYKQEEAYNPSLLELAKLDFNLLQLFHVAELKIISRWWKDLYGEVGMSYARDRIVECYFWSNSVYYEQEHTHARMILAKIIALTSLLDDTYDVFATLEESRKLNEAIQRWDLSYVSFLPEYMKKYYVKLISTFREVEELEPEKFRVAYNMKAFQILSKHYFQEVEWFHDNYVPGFKEHTDVSVISSGAPMICVALLVGMGEVATKEAFEWAIGCTDAVKASGEVTRFLDDLAAFKNGKNKMDVATSVECYIKEYEVTDDIAITKIESLNQDAWKTMNQAFLESGARLPLVKRAANLAMSMEFLFQNKRDAYTFSKYNNDTIEQLFVKPIPL